MHVLCAVSGGADSVAMLRLLCESEMHSVTVAHFEHGIRAKDSLEDAAFVEKLCDNLGVPRIMTSADVPALARAHHIGLEHAARIARHTFLRNAMADVGADCIALAHHQGDQAETLLMHMGRGAGLRGASCMAEFDPPFWRPLIAWSKPQILSYLQKLGQPFREDATNAVLDNPRNLVRHRVLPALELAYPRAQEALCRFCHIARDEDHYLAQQTDEFLKTHVQTLPNGSRIRLNPAAHRAIMRRAFACLLNQTDFATLDRLATLCTSPYERGVIGELRGKHVAYRSSDFVYLIDPGILAPVPTAAIHGARLDGVGSLSLSPSPPRIHQLPPLSQTMNPAALKGAMLRCRLPGDRFRMLNAHGSRKLSDVFSDRKIDRPLRDFWPLIVRENQVLWIPGIGVSDEARVLPGADAAILAAWSPDHPSLPTIHHT